MLLVSAVPSLSGEHHAFAASWHSESDPDYVRVLGANRSRSPSLPWFAHDEPHRRRQTEGDERAGGPDVRRVAGVDSIIEVVEAHRQARRADSAGNEQDDSGYHSH